VNHILGLLGLVLSGCTFIKAQTLVIWWLRHEQERDNPLFKESRIEFVRENGVMFIRAASVILGIMSLLRLVG
jgi:hypothetical protein